MWLRLTMLLCLVGQIMLQPARVSANNNLFLPGDAFFPTVITQNNLEQLRNTPHQDRVFSYSSFDNYEPAFCGYAGYLNAKIPAVDERFMHNLALAYRQLRESQFRKLVEYVRDGKTELIETNGMQVLFYSADFDFPRHAVGLRYNEHWVRECVRFGHKADRLRLCSLIDDPAAVERCWRDSERVPGLNATLPDVPLKPIPAQSSPVVITGSVKAFIISPFTLKQLFQPDRHADLTITVVDTQQLRVWEYRDSHWQIRVQD